MGTQRIDILIKKVRRETANEEYSDNAGIPDTQIVGYFNDGLSLLEREINGTNAIQFKKEVLLDLVSGQEKYDLPADYLASGGVMSVEYAFGDPGGSNPQWQPLRKITDLERSRGNSNEIPCAYQVVNRQIWLKSIPSQSKTDGLRVVYTKALTRFDVRRGQVEQVTLNTGTGVITDLEVFLASYSSEFSDNEACCVVDADGNIKMANIKLNGSDVNTITGDVPVRSDYTFDTGETIAVNDYLVFGKNSSTHQLDLDESIEPYLCAYASWKVMVQDSNTDSGSKAEEFKLQAQSIMSAYAKQNEDIQLIPEL